MQWLPMVSRWRINLYLSGGRNNAEQVFLSFLQRIVRVFKPNAIVDNVWSMETEYDQVSNQYDIWFVLSVFIKLTIKRVYVIIVFNF